MQCRYCSKLCNSKFCSLKCVGASQAAEAKLRYETNPKLCLHCLRPLPHKQRHNKFCNQSCAAIYNNTGRIRVDGGRQRTSATRPPPTFDPNAALVENSTAKRKEAKKYLIETGMLPHHCVKCERGPEWMGQPLVLILDHINGINDDNRLENLRFLCPNCNSQTATFCRGAGQRKGRVKARELVAALKATNSIREALDLLGMDPTGNNYARVTRLFDA